MESKKILKIDAHERLFKRMYNNTRQGANRLGLYQSWWYLSLKICGEKQNLRQVLQRKPFWRSQKAPQKTPSRDEIANVNFLHDDIVHALQNTIDSVLNSATDRRGYVLERRFTEFSKITQYDGHYTVHGNSRSPIILPMEHSYTTRFQVMADYWSNFR